MSLDQKLQKISEDLQQVQELYDFAEKVYPYEKIREPRHVRT
jgi:hypothetical protein